MKFSMRGHILSFSDSCQQLNQEKIIKMTISELIKAAQAIEEKGDGHLPVVCLSSFSGAIDKAFWVYVSDHVGDEGPFDLDSEFYVAIVS